MSQSFRRAVSTALTVAIALLGPWTLGQKPGAALFAMRPGPIDRPLSVVSADFDRDGRGDLVVADYQAGVLQVLIGQPDGTFEPLATSPFGVGAATFVSPTSAPFQQIVADLNPDDVDADSVPNATDDCPNIFNPIDVNTGRQLDDETAKGPDGACGTADDRPLLNGPDGLCGTADDVLGDGVGEACEQGDDSDGDGIVDVTIDTDGDGIVDYDPVTLVLDNCPRLPNPNQLDLNQDRVGDACAESPDILVLGASQGNGSTLGVVRIRLNDGEGGFVGRPSYLTGVGPGSITVADFTGDTRPDLAITVTTLGVVQLLMGQPDGLFGAQAVLTAGKGAQGSVAADLDGDGDKDYVVANRAVDTTPGATVEPPSLSVFLRSPSGLPPTASATVPTQDAPATILTGDLNGDAFADLVVLDQGADGVTGRVEVFLGAANGTPVAGQMLPLGAGHAPRTGLLRDLDGDGKADLALADFTGRQLTFFAGVGDGTFTAGGSVPTRAEPSDIVALDLPPVGGLPDLAVLQFSNRLDLLQNGGGLAFAPAPSSPASPWRDTSAMAMFGADTLVGIDLVLLQRSAARLDVLSGNGDGVFRPAPTQAIEGLATAPPANASVMQVADLRTDSRPDLAVLDPTAGKVTVLSNDLTGLLVERGTTAITPGAQGLSSGTLLASITDIDRDGVVNDLDDCPTIFNPPLCRVTDPECPMEIACKNTALAPTNCGPGDPATLDPTTQQCDSDRNGIGDHCQVLSENCAGLDSDFDAISDYNSVGLARSSGFLDFDRDGFGNLVDNCPTVSNIDQADNDGNFDGDGVGDACEVLSDGQPVDPDDDGVPTYDPSVIPPVVDNCPALPNPSQQDNDSDGVGNACIIDAALDNCPATINIRDASGHQLDSNGDGVGDACAFAPGDLLLANPVAGEVTLLSGDGTGAMHPAGASPLGPLQGPVAAVTGHFALNCPVPTLCFGRTDFDIAVATRGTAGNPSDDGIIAFIGDGMGGFTPVPAEPAGGDPSGLLLAPDQPICTLSNDPGRPNLRFDFDRLGDLLAVVEPGTPGIRVLLVSNTNSLDPLQSPLITPVGQPGPLPVPAPLRAVASLDANRDGRIDLLSLSTPPGGPTVFRLFLGLGNGLFFTDPTLDPAPVQAELDFPATGFIDIKVDNVFPDVAAFNVTDQAPNTLFNILPERADIDGSGRVDGYDLAVLAAAFGSERGEDFILLPDATLAQTGTGATRRLLASGTLVPGQDLPDSSGVCASGLRPLTGAYGLPVDINLDGIVDGEDLAFLASRFGGSPRP